MLTLTPPDKLYSYPVTVQVPVGEGNTAPHEFTAQFKFLPSDKVDVAIKQDDQAFLAAVLHGWEDIAEHHGKALAYSEEARGQLAHIPYFVRGVTDAYLMFVAGLPAKNSLPSRAD